MPKIPLAQAYPGISFRRRTTNWWARLCGTQPECEHLQTEHNWVATYAPDTAYLRGKARAVRQPERPHVSMCPKCLLGVLRQDLSQYEGRVVAFEPDAEQFTQYFFLETRDFEEGGLLPELSAAIQARLQASPAKCSTEKCNEPATWLWFSREEIANLDDAALIHKAPGRALCRGHGAAQFCLALGIFSEANIFYLNTPYGEMGAYIWI